MPLINTSLPNLIQGVSQQPDAVRYDGQCEEQENALSSVVEGLQKRPAAEFVGTSNLINSALSDDAFFHLYKRSDSERYCITQDNNTLRIHNADTGVKCAITEQTTSDFTITNNEVDTAGTYLASSKPKQNFKGLTIGDSTFLLNTAETTEISTSPTSDDLSNGSLVFIKQGDFTKRYGVKINSTTTEIFSRPTTPTNNPSAPSGETEDTATKSHMADSVSILDSLRDQISGTDNGTTYTQDSIDFTLTLVGNLLYLNTTSSTEYTIIGIDGLAGEGIGVVHREVSSLADLPTTAPHNFKVKIIGDAELGQDDYYCEFKLADGGNVATDTIGEGSWIECAGGLIETDIDASKMPRMLVSTAPDVFEIRRMSFNALQAGDTDSNPYPSFIDNKINNLFQYKNRLGFLAQDTVIMSEAGFGGYNAATNVQSYNFFRTTVTDLLDGDPIDVSVSSNDVTKLRSAQPFQENLILFSDNSQFVLKGGELLTPKSISVTAVTNFDTVNSVDPIPLGSYLYFPFQRGGFSGVREFTVNASADIYDATEITAHVPQYIPNNLTSLTGSNSEQLIAMTSGTTASSGSETDIFIYKYFFNNQQQKGLSSWSKFSIVGAVRGIKFIDSELYILQSKNGKTNLLKISLEAGRQDPSGYNTHLDMRISATVGGAVSDIQLPYTPESTDTVQVYTDDGLLLESSVNGSVVTLTTPPSATTNVYVGVRYSMKYVFSRLVFKAPSGNSKSPSNANDFLIRNGSIFFNNSASFKVKVQPDGREEQVNEFTPTVIGTQLPDEFKLTDGAFRFPVFTKASSAKITLENNTALPCNLQSAEFESFIHARSNRYG